MNFSASDLIEMAAGIVTAFGGVYTTYKHVNFSIKLKKENEKKAILTTANEEMSKIKAELEEKIKRLEIEFAAQKLNVSKDFEHFKNTYNGEIRALSEKIENLREDLSQQHQALVGLLTKLVNSK